MMEASSGGKIRTAVLLFSILVCVVLAARSRWSAPRPAPDSVAPVIIEVKGDVPAPGIYALEPEKATVAAAIARAGFAGGLPGDSGARRLAPGESVDFRRAGPAPEIRIGRMPAAALLASGQKLDLNTATVEDLLFIPHMRPPIAELIVERREKKPFENLEDLREIRGIGPKTALMLKDYLQVNGRE